MQKGDVISDAATIWAPIVTPDPSTRSIKGGRTKGQRAATSEESIVIASWEGTNISLPLNEAQERVRHMLRVYSSGRAGQTSFRKNILAAYGDQCAVSGCTIKFLLDAAHTRPHCLYPTNEGKQSKRINMERSDGMPLRKDIHWLYDLNLIRIHPTTLEVIIDQSIEHDYGNLTGNSVQIPSSFTPFEHQKLREGLQWRWDEYGKLLEGFTPEI